VERQVISTYIIKAKRTGNLVRPETCPFHLCTIDDIGCLYLNSEGHVKKKCWRAIIGSVGVYDSIQCRIGHTDLSPIG
jgi:hypothetical protein